MDFITGIDYNPFYFGMTYFIEYGNWATKTFLENEAGIDFEGSQSAPSDAFKEMFGEVYDDYWKNFVYTASPMTAWIKWIILNYNPAAQATEFYAWWIELILGFKPECPGVQAGMQTKLMQVLLLIPQWIMYLIVIIIRLIALVIYSIFLFL